MKPELAEAVQAYLAQRKVNPRCPLPRRLFRNRWGYAITRHGVHYLVKRIAANADIQRESLSAHKLRSEEHTSELQSRENLVCRLLLEKKKNKSSTTSHTMAITI